MAGILQVELGKRGIRAYNIDPGLIVHEAQKALLGEDNALVRIYRGAPVSLMTATIKWIVTDPEAVAMSGQTIFAQRLCKERQLVPGWPPQRTK
jgi:NAD(P)-dependent dehydrogenase (short-subunit alcohol dehydrogenase family)